jgi:hypothetical protein
MHILLLAFVSAAMADPSPVPTISAPPGFGTVTPRPTFPSATPTLAAGPYSGVAVFGNTKFLREFKISDPSKIQVAKWFLSYDPQRLGLDRQYFNCDEAALASGCTAVSIPGVDYQTVSLDKKTGLPVRTTGACLVHWIGATIPELSAGLGFLTYQRGDARAVPCSGSQAAFDFRAFNPNKRAILDLFRAKCEANKGNVQYKTPYATFNAKFEINTTLKLLDYETRTTKDGVTSTKGGIDLMPDTVPIQVQIYCEI